MQSEFNLNMAARLLERLGPAVVNGHYAERPFPTEAEAVELFGVSRTVIREAIKSLTAKGMLESRPRIGQRVQPREKWNILDADVLRWMSGAPHAESFLREIAELRKGIEPVAAGLAAQAGTSDSLSLIETAFFDLKQENGDGLAAAIHRFHDAVVNSAGNAVLSRLQMTISLPLANLAATLARSGKPNLDLYASIVNAVRARDVIRAETATRWLLDEESRVRLDANPEVTVKTGLASAG